MRPRMVRAGKYVVGMTGAQRLAVEAKEVAEVIEEGICAVSIRDSVSMM